MKCPSCKKTDLSATRIDGDIPAYGCTQCEGALISLLYYREWAERTPDTDLVISADLNATAAEEHESHKALCCPKCSKIMTKFHIAGCTKNRLDLCTSCDEAWLDGGEWELLKALQLSKHIPSVFTEAWQRKIRHEINEKNLKERFARIVGEEDIEKAEQFRNWIKDHKKRAELLFYIGQE